MIKYLKELKPKKMSSYGVFAPLYDRLTENVEYEARAKYMVDILGSNGIKGGNIIDLACGTGSIAEWLIKSGFNVTGVDLSADMLTIAQNKLLEYEGRYSLVLSDIKDFEPVSKAEAVVCCLDSINHLTSKKDVQSTFNLVKSYLKNDGLFVFDVNTLYKHQQVLADNTFVFENDDFYLVWDNELLDNRTIRILLDIFIFNGSSYDRFSEEFTEIAYTPDELVDMLKKAGFESVDIYDDMSKKSPVDNSERIYFVCK